MSKIILNGVLTDESEMPSRFDDGTYLYGAGVFETMLLLNNALPLLPHHLTRLTHSLTALDIDLSLTETDLSSAAAILASYKHLNSGTLNLYVSAGNRAMQDGRIHFDAPYWAMVLRNTGPTIATTPIDCCLTHALYPHGFLNQHKTMSYLYHIHAAKQTTYHPILVDQHGAIMETPFYGVAFISSDTLCFPYHDGILPSTSRQFLIHRALDLGLTARIQPVYKHEIADFDAAFLHNAVKGIVPVQIHEQDQKGPVLIDSNDRIPTLASAYWNLLS